MSVTVDEVNAYLQRNPKSLGDITDFYELLEKLDAYKEGTDEHSAIVGIVGGMLTEELPKITSHTTLVDIHSLFLHDSTERAQIEDRMGNVIDACSDESNSFPLLLAMYRESPKGANLSLLFERNMKKTLASMDNLEKLHTILRGIFDGKSIPGVAVKARILEIVLCELKTVVTYTEYQVIWHNTVPQSAARQIVEDNMAAFFKKTTGFAVGYGELFGMWLTSSDGSTIRNMTELAMEKVLEEISDLYKLKALLSIPRFANKPSDLVAQRMKAVLEDSVSQIESLESVSGFVKDLLIGKESLIGIIDTGTLKKRMAELVPA